MIVNVSGDDRRFIHARGANGSLTGKEISPDMLRQARAIYVGGYCLSDQPSPANIAAIFRRASEIGVKTVLDVVIPRPADYWPFLEPVLPWTDVFLPNCDEAELITGEKDPVRQALRFRDAGAKTVVITCGAEGSVTASAAGQIRAGGFQVAQVDGTGSGDAFAAGYIHGLLSGVDVSECVRIGQCPGSKLRSRHGRDNGRLQFARARRFSRHARSRDARLMTPIS